MLEIFGSKKIKQSTNRKEMKRDREGGRERKVYTEVREVNDGPSYTWRAIEDEEDKKP